LLGGNVRLGLGSLYPALGSLERDGLVVSRKVVPAPRRGGRSRIYYDLTPRGEEVAAEQRSLLVGALRGCGSEATRPDAVERMRERFRAGARLSELGLELRRRRLAHGGRP
jgi:DNA-binding PadR family transcriptional regulator